MNSAAASSTLSQVQAGGHVVAASHSTVNIYGNEPTEDPFEAQQRYLEWQSQRCNVLPIANVGGDDEGGVDVGLDQVYIQLDTTTRIPFSEEEKAQRKQENKPAREDRPLTALEAAASPTHRRLLLLGQPGSGKSTMVRQLVAEMCLALLGRKEAPTGWAAPLLPLFVTLSDLAPALSAIDPNALAQPKAQAQLCAAVYSLWRKPFDDLKAAAYLNDLDKTLRKGAVLLIFDGLDEVPDLLRNRVRTMIGALQNEYPAIQQIIVTCRIRSYHEKLLPGFKVETLAAFDNEKIEQFVRAWYLAQTQIGKMDQAHAAERRDDLLRAVQGKALRELSSNPMLLTTMAIIHRSNTELPDERVTLYSLAVSVLLKRWQNNKNVEISPTLQNLLKNESALRPLLQEIAYAAHRQQANDSKNSDSRNTDSKNNEAKNESKLLRWELLQLLEKSGRLDNLGLCEEFLEYIDKRAGLLMGEGGSQESGKPERYHFPHRTFQEYLAGCQMIRGRDRDLINEFRQRAQEGDFWWLAAQLGSEELYYSSKQDPGRLLDLAYALCPENSPNNVGEWRAVVWAGHIALLVGKNSIEADPGIHESGANWLIRLRQRLLAAMRQPDLAPIERADAGRSLAKLGDVREEVLDPLKIEWCDVPAGGFLLGSKDDSLASNDESPQLSYTIKDAYRISRYPITNAQFQKFVECGGYKQQKYWTEAEKHGYWSKEGFKGWQDNKSRTTPFDFDEPFNLANHPVVGVSWFEAIAFCRWLTEEMQRVGKKWQIRLPTEPEWEKAARSSDGRRYPWGNETDRNRANYYDSGIGTTSAVGCFPNEESPYQLEETAGNVWEWCSTAWVDSYKNYAEEENNDPTDYLRRVLRGGAFNLSGSNVRCACRVDDVPYSRYDDVGFRVVASPFTSGL